MIRSSPSVDAFEAALASKRPFQCCRQDVPIEALPDGLSADFRITYGLLVLELSTPDPIYCSNRLCGAFIPLANAVGPDLIDCFSCLMVTCQFCRMAYHPGIECVADVATQEARALAAAQGWKECPTCRNMVEKASGCLHMTCRCGVEFCYACGNRWGHCAGTCGRY